MCSIWVRLKKPWQYRWIWICLILLLCISAFQLFERLRPPSLEETAYNASMTIVERGGFVTMCSGSSILLTLTPHIPGAQDEEFTNGVPYQFLKYDLVITLPPVIDDEVVEALNHIPNNRNLDMVETNVTNPIIAEIRPKPSLLTLNLHDTQITGDTLPEFPNLIVLDVMRTRVDDAGLQRIRNLPRLESLNLSQTLVTFDGIRSLSTCKSLKNLQLSEINFPEGTTIFDDFTTLEELRLLDCKITEVDLEHLKTTHPQLNVNIVDTMNYYDIFQGLNHSEYYDQQRRYELPVVTASGVQRLAEQARADNVSRLSFSEEGGVNDECLRWICEIPSLKILSVYNTEITDAGLVHLKGLPNLELLNLSHNKITDKELVHVENLHNLNTLMLSGTKLTDAGLVRLSRLKNLKKLRLDSTNIYGKGLAHLETLHNLESLDLDRTKLTDAAIDQLVNLQSLKYLNLNNTDMTEAGVDFVRQKLPATYIIARFNR